MSEPFLRVVWRIEGKKREDKKDGALSCYRAGGRDKYQLRVAGVTTTSVNNTKVDDACPNTKVSSTSGEIRSSSMSQKEVTK